MLTNNDLINIGFKPIPHFTIGNTVVYDLGRHRQLSASCIGTANEFVFLCEQDPDDERVTTDLICVHNFDYHKELTMEKIQGLIKYIEDGSSKK